MLIHHCSYIFFKFNIFNILFQYLNNLLYNNTVKIGVDMKKFFIILFMMFLGISVNADDFSIQAQNQFGTETALLNAEVTFDWFNISQVKREEIVENYKKIIFKDDEVYKYKRKLFREKYSDFLKDKNYKEHYRLASNGVTENEYAKICAFYYKNSILIIYALQYKNNMKNAFYYDAYGRLRFVDVMEGNYPEFPYWSKQYTSNGKMISAVYFVSKDIQYMYNPEGKFQGVWYKDKMFNINAKQTMTRTNW